MRRAPEDILNLAEKATRSVLRGRPGGWTMEDWQDMQQEAAAAICELPGDAHEGTCVIAAKHAVYDWMRVWLRSWNVGPYLEYIDYDGVPYDYLPDPPWALDYLEALPPLLDAQRAEKVDEDMAYLRLRLRGYSTAGVAMELGISERNAYAIRERLMPRLERIARGEGPLPWAVNLQPGSVAALERINSDPDMLARRAEAIRAGWARRKQQRAEMQRGEG